jgi:peptidoglycan/xylan/chitin deacetylase (PgdA/CDA1 family)
MMAEGHQIASHTWSHQNASQLTTQQMKNQMHYNEIALDDILGFFPTYMRFVQFLLPPFLPARNH